MTDVSSLLSIVAPEKGGAQGRGVDTASTRDIAEHLRCSAGGFAVNVARRVGLGLLMRPGNHYTVSAMRPGLYYMIVFESGDCCGGRV